MTTSALATATKLLSRREHGREELRQKLAQRDYSEEEITATLDRLAQTDLQSDQRYCRAYVRSHQTTKGNALLRHQLRTRGASDTDITQAIADLPPEKTRAANIAAKAAARGKTPQQIRDHLNRNGFSADTLNTLPSAP